MIQMIPIRPIRIIKDCMADSSSNDDLAVTSALMAVIESMIVVLVIGLIGVGVGVGRPPN